MRATGDAQTFTWSATGASAAFDLLGGTYQLMGFSANWNGGNLAIQQLLLDGATWANVTGTTGGTSASTVTSNTTEVTLPLAPGQYRFNVTTTTAGIANICRVPND